jgi:hypothetical protein
LAAGGISNVILVFWPIRWLGGIGSLRHTVIVGMYAIAILNPIAFILMGVASKLYNTKFDVATSAAIISFYDASLLADLHHVSYIRAIIASSLGSFGVFLIASATLLSFVYFSINHLS